MGLIYRNSDGSVFNVSEHTKSVFHSFEYYLKRYVAFLDVLRRDGRVEYISYWDYGGDKNKKLYHRGEFTEDNSGFIKYLTTTSLDCGRKVFDSYIETKVDDVEMSLMIREFMGRRGVWVSETTEQSKTKLTLSKELKEDILKYANLEKEAISLALKVDNALSELCLSKGYELDILLSCGYTRDGRTTEALARIKNAEGDSENNLKEIESFLSSL